MEDYDKIGAFYLGNIVDNSTGKVTDEPLLYDSKNLTTHAVCLGMTGSGKTGLGIALLEEAGLDKIPAIIIDPKGDVSNLLLTFPDLSAEEFLPWVDPSEAEKKGLTLEKYAAETAKTWKEGLLSSGEGPERIKKLLDSVDMVIYTPANNSGTPISILSSFSAPSKDDLEDDEIIRDRIQSLASSILSLVGINADPIKSREHILISTIINHSWQKGENLDLASLIQMILKPPFTKIGALDIDTFYPLKERSDLSIRLNNLLASPGFKAWMEGDALDIKQLLHTKEGKPKFSIFSIAHLSDGERMFFVTLLLNELITWMRRQPGTSSLRALLYMDEIFGYFPPTAMPPSKLPMLTLLKQARAYGLGIVLATQNPVDLDYKGLSNCGTWFIGKLQTARDKSRVTEGLKIASNGEFDDAALDKLLSNIAQRTFIMRSIYEKEPILFKTRWALSYLRGPLTLSQIQELKKSNPNYTAQAERPPQDLSASSDKPIISSDIPELYVNPKQPIGIVTYHPQIVGIGKLHYVNAKFNVDIWQDLCWIAPSDDDGQSILWEKGENLPDLKSTFAKAPLPKSQFEDLPSGLMQVKNYNAFKKAFESFLYQSRDLTIFKSQELNLISKPEESEGEFRARTTLALRESRDIIAQKLREKYSGKIETLTKKVKVAEEKAAQKQQKSLWQKVEAFLSFLSTLLGALVGRGITKGTITQAGTSLRRAGKIGVENQSAAQAEEDLKNYQAQLDELHNEMQKEIDGLYTTSDIDTINIDRETISPRKSDISIDKIALVWIAKA